MGVFDPDDFSGQPYVGGMNQALHFVFGAALLGVFHFLFALPMFWAVLTSGAGIVFWEGWQLKEKDAKLSDYIFDLCYWVAGVVCWAAAILWGFAEGVIEIAPVVPLFVWLIEYTRLSLKDDAR